MLNNIVIGTSGWSYPHWRGTFYPNKLPQKKWFAYYTNKFSGVEIDATYYRGFNDASYLKWYAESPTDFQYVIKIHRIILHRKNLKGDEIKRCTQSATLLKEKLALLLLQIPEHSYYNLEYLEKILLAFPDSKKLAIEFRHPKWLNEATYKLLKKYGATYCWNDFIKENMLDWLTSEYGYIRLHGPNNYSKKQLTNIAQIVQNLNKNGAKHIYIFFNNDAFGYAPKNALKLIKLLEIRSSAMEYCQLT